MIENEKKCDAITLNSLEELYFQYKKPFLGYIYKMTNSFETAEDLFQESFIKITKKIHTLKELSKFKSWGFKIVANTCRDWHRKKKKFTVDYVEDIEAHQHKIIISERTSTDKIWNIINNILNSFNDKEREVFILKHYEHMKYYEISKIVNISQKTARKYMNKVIIKLIDELEKLNFISGSHFNFDGGDK